ncbi:MAG: glycosyltransferase family 4 protein [Chloroflexota bacterium]|nr:glycosyltransferase family 4 protein [Chloroflexota bacterium]
MRVLMLAQWYDPIIGGEEIHVRTLAATLAGRGHDVAVATLAHQDRPSVELDGHVRVHRIRATVQRLGRLFADQRRQSAPPFPDPEAVLALREIIRRERPEIVHAHNWLVHSYLPLHAGSGAGLVLTLHDYSLVCAKKNLTFRGVPCSGPALEKCLRCAAAHYGPAKGSVTVAGIRAMGVVERRAVDRFIAVSRAVADGNRLEASGLPYEVIPNFIPDEHPPAGPGDAALLGLLPAEPYLLFVGGLARLKGVDVLLRAYRRLAAPPPLVLIGYRTSERLASLEDLPAGVTVVTDWPQTAVMEAWRRSLLGIVPSTWPEPFGLVTLEAMAAGRALVASRIGGLVDIVADGTTGVLVEPGDDARLAAAIAALIRDDARRDRMGRAAQDRVRDFRAGAVVPRLEAVYRDVLAAAGDGHGARTN